MVKLTKISIFLFLLILFSLSVSALTIDSTVIINSSGTIPSYNFWTESSINNLTINSTNLLMDDVVDPFYSYAYFKDELTNASLINKTIIVNYPDGSTETATTDADGKITFGLLYDDEIQIGEYEFIYSSLDGYVTPLSFTGTVTDTPFNETYSLYKGRVTISVYDQASNTLINGTNISISFISDAGQFTNITSTGVLSLDNITAADYAVEFKATGYENANYLVSITNSSTLSLDTYMLATGSPQTILTFKDRNLESVISGISLSIEQIINDDWVLINVLTSDISGRVVFNYEDNAKYRFTTSNAGYEDKSFTLNPIIFTSYNIWLDKVSEEQTDQDYSRVSIRHYPEVFYNDRNNTVTVSFISPTGEFQEYGFNATYKTEFVSGSGVNAIGGVLTDILEIENAVSGDRVILNYYYKLTDGTIKYYTLPYTISDIDSPGTFSYNAGETYGLGLFERTLITVLVVVGVAGAAFLFGGLLAAGLLAMLVFGYITRIGFLSGWVTIPSMILIFIITSWGATR